VPYAAAVRVPVYTQPPHDLVPIRLSAVRPAHSDGHTTHVGSSQRLVRWPAADLRSRLSGCAWPHRMFRAVCCVAAYIHDTHHIHAQLDTPLGQSGWHTAQGPYDTRSAAATAFMRGPAVDLDRRLCGCASPCITTPWGRRATHNTHIVYSTNVHGLAVRPAQPVTAAPPTVGTKRRWFGGVGWHAVGPGSIGPAVVL
jgi:hypothetical protein